MARKIVTLPSLPLNSEGEIIATVGSGSSNVAGSARRGAFPVDSATGAIVISGLNVPHNPAFKRKPNSQYLSGRQRDLANFNFLGIYANGEQIYADALRTTHKSGIPNVLTRVVEANGALTASSPSGIPANDKAFWRLTILPEHPVTLGRPRNMIIGNDVEYYKHYRMKMVFRLKNNDLYGWSTHQAALFNGLIFALSQQSDATMTDQFSAGQPNQAASPLYFKIRGNMIYPDMKVITEEMGCTADDLEATSSYTVWDVGDTEYSTRHKTPIRVLSGRHFHEIILDFYLDERRLRDGGMGYYRATFDGEPWFEHKGITAAPRNANNKTIKIQPRWGMYETETQQGALPGATPCSTVASCTIERSMDFFVLDCMEVTP